jgi:hypothetical protein
MWRSGSVRPKASATADPLLPFTPRSRRCVRQDAAVFDSAAKSDRGIERAGVWPRRTAGGAIHSDAGRSGHVAMKSIRPDNTDPIPLRSAPQNVGTILIRFVGLLIVAVVVLATMWLR